LAVFIQKKNKMSRYLIQQDMIKNTAGYGGFDGSGDFPVSSQIHIVHTYESHYNKGEP